MQVIIGLVGAKGAGKNTFAQFVRDRYPFVQELALANKLKAACAAVFAVEREYFDLPELKEQFHHKALGVMSLDRYTLARLLSEFGVTPTDALIAPHLGKYFYTPRQIAQYVGTEVLRVISPDIHCQGLMLDAPKDAPFIVTDVRFPNEYAFFAKVAGLNFYPVYVANKRAEEKAALDNHESERHVLTIAEGCTRIDNNGTLEDFRQKVSDLVDRKLGSLR